jgi:hypothetical protein
MQQLLTFPTSLSRVSSANVHASAYIVPAELAIRLKLSTPARAQLHHRNVNQHGSCSRVLTADTPFVNVNWFMLLRQQLLLCCDVMLSKQQIVSRSRVKAASGCNWSHTVAGSPS